MDTVVVFTGKDIGMMRSEGGSGHWKVKPERIGEATYLVAVRNWREQWSIKDIAHGTAFLVGRITEPLESEYEGRVVIGLSEYATIQVDDAWHRLTGGQRYPVAYMDSKSVQKILKINFNDLAWHPFEERNAGSTVTAPSSPITAAKATLAAQLGIPIENIEIVIRA